MVEGKSRGNFSLDLSFKAKSTGRENELRLYVLIPTHKEQGKGSTCDPFLFLSSKSKRPSIPSNFGQGITHGSKIMFYVFFCMGYIKMN
jgi:hypothetical protein